MAGQAASLNWTKAPVTTTLVTPDGVTPDPEPEPVRIIQSDQSADRRPETDPVPMVTEPTETAVAVFESSRGGESRIRALFVGSAALLLALCSASFSVYGISKLFAGAATAALILGGSLEYAKFAGVSFLNWYWKDCGWIKWPLCFATVILMLITSAGIYGFLSDAYMKSAVGLEKSTAEVQLLEDQKTHLQAQRDLISKQIDTATGSTNTKRNLMTALEPQRKELDAKLADVDSKIIDLKKASITQKSDIGPLIFVAKALNMETEHAVNIFIMAITLIFDPLAVCLVLAFNYTIRRTGSPRT